MNIEPMRTRSYRSFKADGAELPAAASERGLAPKSTCPRRVRRPSCRPSDVKAVMDLRRKHPFMGKVPIQRMLERKGLRLSISAVGRILSRAIAIGHTPQPLRASSAKIGIA